MRELLADPLRYVALEQAAQSTAPRCDPRLSAGANRLRRLLVSWDGLSGQLTRSLCQYAPAGLRAAEARVLAPLIEQAIGSGHRATEQLESVRVGSALHTPGEAAHG